MPRKAAVRPAPSPPAAADKAVLAPQRSNGRERVAQILRAAADVIAQRGYDAATMKEIAARADTRVGSLYRFFPTKDHIAEVLLQQYVDGSETQWAALVAHAPGVSARKLGDMLLDAYAQTRREHPAIPALLDSGAVPFSRRLQFRTANLARIGAALRAHAPHAKPAAIRRIAVIMLYNMRTMNALQFEATAPNGRGAIAELRISVRCYLEQRLAAS